MKTISNIEREVNQIRLKIYEETKHLTSEQYKERLKKITNETSKKHDFKVITSADDKNNRNARDE